MGVSRVPCLQSDGSWPTSNLKTDGNEQYNMGAHTSFPTGALKRQAPVELGTGRSLSS